jgi:hypothetical protein
MMRIEFEAAMAKQLSSEGYSDFSIEMMFERGSDDEYRSIRVNGAYWGWQASRAHESDLLAALKAITNSGTDAIPIKEAFEMAHRAIERASGGKV